MPKPKQSLACRLRAYVREFGDNIFTTDGTVLYCKICDIKVSSEKKFNVSQHIARDKHIIGLEKKNQQKISTTQTLLNGPSTASTFNYDLCKALLCSNIPLYKLSQPSFRKFLEKYTNKIIPDQSTLRKKYVTECYEETINNIRAYASEKKIWVSIDETTDVAGRYVANVIIGTLEIDSPGKIFLLNSEVLDKANYATISRLFDKSLLILWPEGIRHENILLFLSDAAPYMVKAGKTLKIFNPKMEHITCVAHALHRVCEEIRLQFPKVDKLISNMKKNFLKAPSRVQIFRSIAPNIPLPPEPILTRWGTWINAAIYYCEHFSLIKRVIIELDEDDAISIKKVQDLIKDSNLECNLTYMKSNFSALTSAILRLEKTGCLLSESIKIVLDVQNAIDKAQYKIGKAVQLKMKTVLEKNTGFKSICTVSKILNGEEVSKLELPEDLNLDDIAYLKFSPITSVDVERSFSSYKTLLTDNRRSFIFENLKESLIVQCNNKDVIE